MILHVENVNTYYGTSHILFDVSLEINKGEVVCLLGRNGAGKTTMLRTIMGLTPPKSGSIKLYDKEIRGNSPDIIAKKGIGFVPDNRLIFPDLTVKENLEIAHKKGAHQDDDPWTTKKIYELFPKLKILEKNLGGYLSGGEQQMLTIGRTLMGNPEVLLLDEPAEGLAPLIVKSLAEQILKLKYMGLTILLCEQNLLFATTISDRAYVISKGKIEFHGTMKALSENDQIKKTISHGIKAVIKIF